MPRFNRLLLFGLTLVLLGCWFGAADIPAMAHPADEWCADDRSIDPALCRALAAADAEAEIEPQFSRPAMQTVALYLKLGFIHILPRGSDHILFVLALFFASTRFRPLLIQISVFTVAHTLTLVLAASGKINAPPDIIEPLIAASIAFVAIENLFFKEMTKWRPLIVFGFGLFHGLGFAGVLADLGLPQDQFLISLIGFNIGVELGQITVVVGAWLVLHWLYHKPWFRSRIAMPACMAIAAIGVFWAVQRLLF